MLKSNYILSFSALIASSVLCLNTAVASVTLGGTRFIYHDSQDSLSISAYDRDNIPYLVQSWFSPYNEKTDQKISSNSAKIPFVVTPPLFRMNPGDTNTINIVKTDTSTLPQDRESIFYFNFKAIPGLAKSSSSSLMVSVSSSMKLFYRPEKLTDEEAASAWEKIVVTKHGKSVTIKNPTPYFVTLHKLTIDSQANSSVKNLMVSPFSEKSIPVTTSVHSVNWSALTDQGGITSEKSTTL